MKATKKQIEEGKNIAAKLNVQKLFVNKNGEYFTSENLASLSVGHDKDKYLGLDYSSVKVQAEAETDLSKEIEDINALSTAEDVQEVLDIENESAKRAEIIAACEARIKELEK